MIVKNRRCTDLSFLILVFLIHSISGLAQYEWLNTARIFLIDAYQPPFAPKLEFDAERLARTMQDMHVNVVRDVLATNDREASAWDRWREAPPAARAVTQQ